jgi:diguanylate cyclase (GGDEF)-like protein/PAS domain S-box-containing protein
MENQIFYKNMLENIYEGIYFVDNDRRITFWNKGAERITGFSADEVVNKFCYNNILNHVSENGKKLCLGGCPLHKTIEDGETREAAVYLHHKDGHRVPVSIRAVSLMENDEVIGAVEVFVDDSEKHEVLKNLEEYKVIAMRDQLTDLPNRRYIDSFLASRYNEYKVLGINFGVLFMDIDKFKNFNDIYGHDIGDEVLKIVSKSFLAATRAIDLVGRFGGEEFIAIFAGINETVLSEKAEIFRMLIESTVLRTGDKELNVTISIGATLLKEDDTVETIIKRADILLYKSKEDGRNRVTVG